MTNVHAMMPNTLKAAKRIRHTLPLSARDKTTQLYLNTELGYLQVPCMAVS